MRKRALLASLALCLLLAGCAAPIAQPEAERPSVSVPPLAPPSSPEGWAPVPVYLNGRLFVRGYRKAGFLFLPLSPFSARAGVEQSWSGDEKSFTLHLDSLRVEGRSSRAYFTASGRYLYAPEGWLMRGDELLLPGKAVCRLFGLESEEREDGLFLRGGELRLLESGTDYYALNLAEEDVYWLAHIINAEAKGEPLEGQIAVGNVVLNRVRSEIYPNSVFEVIYDTENAIQFEPVALGSILEDPTRQATIAAYLALEGAEIVDADCLYFMNPKYANTTWFDDELQLTAQIGRHNFYSEKR